MYLRILPVLLIPRDPDERDAIRAAEGADLNGERAGRVVKGVFLAFVAVLVAVFLAGCSSLAALGEGARTARDVARGACAILEASDGGSPAEVTAALAGALRDITAQQAASAARDEARAAEVRALVRVADASFAAAREASERIGALAGTAPVVVPPCPAPAPIAPGSP